VVRRATAAFLGTLAGTALLVGGKMATGSPATTATSAGTPMEDPAAGDGAGTATPALTPAAKPSARPSAKAPAKPAASATGGTAPKPAATTKTTAAAPVTCRTATGSAAGIVSPGQGTVTVTVKVCGGKISSASSVMSGYNYTSNNDAAHPKLDSLAVTYGMTNISKVYVGGVTLTSHAYQTSLKSALAKIG
jgi:hypothetical protein